MVRLELFWRTSLRIQARHLHHQTTSLTPSRVTRLVSAQTDPLLAKAIFDHASLQPNFRHTLSCYHALILKLSHYPEHLSHIKNLLISLKSQPHINPTPSLFSSILNAYAKSHTPQKSLTAFHTMLMGFHNAKPLTKHLNKVLQMVTVKSGYELFRKVQNYGIIPNVTSYNILIRGFCRAGEISAAYKLFNEMFRKGLVPDVESYRVLMQALCRRSQVNNAVELFEDMLNKGFVPDGLCYTSLLNQLCRKKKLREAYKLLCRMKVKGCNPDIVHYNTVIVGFCREGRAEDACKVLADMESNGCLPNLVSYRSLVSGLCDLGMFDEGRVYLEEMMVRGFSPHWSVLHALVKGLCDVGKMEEGFEVLEGALRHGEAPHRYTWEMVVPRVVNEDEAKKLGEKLKEVLKVDIKRNMRIVDAGVGLEEYLINKLRAKTKRINVRY